jgi:hypothetical protein
MVVHRIWVDFFVSSWAAALVFMIDVTTVGIDAIDVAGAAAAGQPPTGMSPQT